MRNHRQSPTSSRGFTLVELLVVVGVMAVMLSIAAIGIQNIDKGQSTITGVATTQSLLDEARNLAIGRGTRARLCIHADASDEQDRYLRFMVVAYERIQRNDAGEETGRVWQVDSRGTSLPNGVYFHPELSSQASSTVNGLGSHSSGGGVNFPGDSRTTRQPNYFFYEFNAEGLCTIEGEDDPGAAFVLCRGALNGNAQIPIVVGNDVGGFVVWRNGRTSPIRDTNLISTAR